jgi:sugar lactone lactonase YvrE
MTAVDVPVEDVTVRVLGEARCHLGEGPAYDAASDTAWWFDILEKRLHEMRLADGAVHVHALPFMASALAFVDDTRQFVAADDGLYLRTLHGGRLTLVVPLEADNPATRSNDGRAHPSGTFWIGTMGRQAEPGAGAIYAFRAGGLTQLFAGITIPNAVCFSPDGAAGYFTDTRTNVLWRVALDPATGLPTGAPRPCMRMAVRAGSTAPSSMPRDGSGAPFGGARAFTLIPRRARSSDASPRRQGSRAARSLSAPISEVCSSPRPVRAWTRPRARLTPITVARSCSTLARRAGPSPASGWEPPDRHARACRRRLLRPTGCSIAPGPRTPQSARRSRATFRWAARPRRRSLRRCSRSSRPTRRRTSRARRFTRAVE